MKNYHFIIILLALGYTSAGQQRIRDIAQEPTQPKYKHASYVHKSITLENSRIRFDVFKRIGGWGWGEVSTPSGKLMAVLDHLGEIMLRDQDIPMRLEADSVEHITLDDNDCLVFNVRSVVVREKLKGTSFEEWMNYPYDQPCLRGKVTITLVHDKPILRLQYELVSTGNYYAKYIRGPWLKVGEASFGTKKDDAIFPGIEWLAGNEWSSGTDWFKDPWALRVVPHPYKVSIPMMALSYQGTGIGLSWNPNATVTGWFNYRNHRAQPVFAVPNFIDRMNNNLIGLMVPDATAEGHENEVCASQPLELKIGQQINFDATLWLTDGNSLDVVTDWIKKNGLPGEKSKWTFKETLDKIAQAYNTNFWHEGEGFGIKQREEDKVNIRVPAYIHRYLRENKNSTLAKELKKKVDWCEAQRDSKTTSNDKQRLSKYGDDLLKIQRADGSFYFDPEGRHYGKDDFRVATSFIEPMGLQYDSALDICMVPALQLLEISTETNLEKYKIAARKTLDYCLPMMRPEGGDFWETPLHAPNLLAAGHAAIAYYQGFKMFGDKRYKEKAIYWMRAILPFTHLWQPDDVAMLYNTKPVLSSSDWYFANWVRDHVQWEVFSVFAQSAKYGIRWEEIDQEIDWKKYHEGITIAAIRWMNVHTDNNWRPHNIPATMQAYKLGKFDYCFPDTYNSTTGRYGGMFIMPDPIAINIYSILDNQAKP